MIISDDSQKVGKIKSIIVQSSIRHLDKEWIDIMETLW